MSELRHLDQNQVQDQCVKIGILEAVYIDTPTADGTCFGAVHVAGLCSRCHEPIGYGFTNGGKLSPKKTLRLEHLFSGDIRCQSDSINAQIKSMSGQQKADFFCQLRNESVMIK